MNDSWSDCGMIFYCDGEGYAIDKEGNTVCLCKREDIERVISGVMSVRRLKNDKQRECIEIILEYRRKKGYGKQEESFKPRGFIGSRPAGNIKRRKRDVRRTSEGKRIPVRKVKLEK